MPDQIFNLLIQLPIVAAFIWYSDRITSRFEAFLREERTAREMSFREIAGELKQIRVELDDHDAKLDQAVVKMDERTRPTKGNMTTRE